jgi:hypothetical protein
MAALGQIEPLQLPPSLAGVDAVLYSQSGSPWYPAWQSYKELMQQCLKLDPEQRPTSMELVRRVTEMQKMIADGEAAAAAALVATAAAATTAAGAAAATAVAGATAVVTEGATAAIAKAGEAAAAVTVMAAAMQAGQAPAQGEPMPAKVEGLQVGQEQQQGQGVLDAGSLPMPSMFGAGPSAAARGGVGPGLVLPQQQQEVAADMVGSLPLPSAFGAGPGVCNASVLTGGDEQQQVQQHLVLEEQQQLAGEQSADQKQVVLPEVEVAMGVAG